MIKQIVFITCMLSFATVHAQHDFRGTWSGALNEVNNLQVSFTMRGDNKTDLKAYLDVPTQGAEDVPCDGVEVRGDSLFIDMKMINGNYVGVLKNVNAIDGIWTQNGLALSLNLKRIEGKLQLNRPQTPKPPYSYNSQDIIFYSRNKGMEFGATITTPKDDDKHPAVILISGSGPQNRDEELFQHKPFAVVADHLTKNGYVVLRVDDRGVGATGGDRTNATSRDFADDVVEAIEYLKTRKEVDKKKIGLYGHSEGGMIAEILAAERKDIDFLILMAAPGVPVKQLMTEQNKALIISGGLDVEVAERYGELYGRIVDAVTSSTSREEVQGKMHKIVDVWKTTTQANIVAQTTGIVDSMSQVMYVEKFLNQVWNKWMVYFLNYNPQPNLAAINCKVLALNGTKDVQVLPESNLNGIRQGLAKSKAKVVEVSEVAGVNHLFQECEKCTAEEYGHLEQTIQPQVLDVITSFLDRHVK